FRSWLMALDININHENENLDSIKMHSNKFKEIDYNLEIDRFHLNDKILKDSLIKRAREELFA
ncbi:hypothetical protein N8994_01460, partial [Gammaproteobacteria bacterium]|nr:hypothetical protein [Gammaproteobacteria bacterium]